MNPQKTAIFGVLNSYKKSFLLITLFICCFKIGYSQAGALDSSFGKNGIVRTDIGYSIGYSSITKQVFSQADGSIFIVLESNGVPLIAKKRPDGSPDSSYGHFGFSVSVTMSNAYAAMQSDGKIVVAGTGVGTTEYVYGFRNTDFIVARYNTDGSLDHTFGENGRLSTNFYDNVDGVTFVAIQSNGKIVVSGFSIGFYDDNYDPDNPGGYLAISRYNPDGSLDKTFNNSGMLISSQLVNNVYTGIETNGKITAAVTTSYGFDIKRYNDDGSTDSSFDSFNGIKRSDGSNFIGKSLALQSDGEIVLGGFWQNDNNNNDFVVARLNINGSTDNTFNKVGVQTTDFGTYNDVLNAIVIQNDGKIVAAGSESNGSKNAFAIARYNTNGSLDNTFDTDGKKTNSITSNDVYANSLAIQSDGKLVAAGFEHSPTDTHVALTRYNTNGSLDNTLNSNGTLIDYLLKQNTALIKTAVQKDGKIAVIGSYWNGTNNTYFVTRYNTDGSLDKTFSTGVIQTADFTLRDIKIQNDGRIVVAGYKSNGTNNDFAVARYNTDGSVDKTFSSDGIQTTDFGSNESAQSIALQADSKIVVAGSYALARYNADGSLDVTFGSDGKQIPNCNVTAVKLQKDGKIVVAGSVTLEEYGDGFLAVGRYNSDGTIDSSFSKGGRLTAGVSNFFSSDPDYGSNIKATTLYIQDDDKIIVGASGGYYPRNFRDFRLCIARLNSDGSFDTSFAGDGTQVGYFKNNSSDASVAMQDDGKILAQCNLYGYDGPSEIGLGYGIARLNIDGTYDSTFATNGLLYSSQDEIVNIQSISIANDRLYAAGYGSEDNKIYIPGYGENVNKYGFLSRYFLTDNKAPTVSLTAPKNNATYLAPAAHIKLSAAASDADGNITKVEFYNGTTLLHTETVVPYGYLGRNVRLGNYTLTAKAYDNSGNITTSAPVHISVVPNKPPVVSITKPVNNRSFAAPGYIHLEAAASDTDGRVTNVKFYNGTTLLRTEYEYPYTYHWENVPVGTYTITAVATDNWGAHTTSAPVTIKVTSSNTIVSSRPASNKTGISNEISINLFPNPVTNIINIYTKGLQQSKPATISIISVSGIVMKTMQTNNSTIQLDVSSLASGVYTIKIVSGDRITYKQFVKL